MSNSIDTSIQFLKSIGPKRSEYFNSIGIQTVHDLLYYFPTRYLDRSSILNTKKVINYVVNGYEGEVTIIGEVVDKELIRYGKKRLLKVSFKDEQGFFECVWFQGIRFFKDKFNENEVYAISAKPVITKYGHLQFAHPDFDLFSSNESKEFVNTGKIIPFYRIPQELRKINFGNISFRKLIHNAVIKYLKELPETLPEYIVADNNLIDIQTTVQNKHFPLNKTLLEKADYRLKFEELFYIESIIAIRKYNIKEKTNGFSFLLNKQLLKDFLKSLPFELTDAQKKVLHEIRLDMESSKPMNRLIQGDVGSGKTIVALIAMIIAITNNKQAAIMAPTEILALQHYEKIKSFLRMFNINVYLLLGGQKAKDKNNTYKIISNGDPCIIIGTHALIEQKVEFVNLALVVIDEQHRFGVAQRLRLISKGSSPDVIVMTATPIPRTLTMTVYGDLDVSIINEMPKNRKPIKTYLRGENKLEEIYSFIKKSAVNGIQSFIVYPLVEESEKLDLKAAETHYSELKDSVFSEVNVGLIHGRMDWNEKKDIMSRFSQKEFDILISTTVIEVGIDIPGANIILINDAHRFGLSQLHQLRGRIGRGTEQGYCILVVKNSFISKRIEPTFSFEFLSDSVIQKNKTVIRLNAMAEHTSGFTLSEIDLKLRGPGDVFGVQQSGLPKFKYADLINDLNILINAKQQAFKVINDDPQLKKIKNILINNIIDKIYSENIKYMNTA